MKRWGGPKKGGILKNRKTKFLVTTTILLLCSFFGLIFSSNLNLKPKTQINNQLEIVNLRTENTKHFQKSDGKFVMEVFAGPVHYKEDYNKPDSPWLDIDSNYKIETPEFTLYDRMPTIVKVFKNDTGYEIESRKTGHKFLVKLDKVDGQELSQIKKTGNLSGFLTHVKAAEKEPVTFDYEISANGVRLWKTIQGEDAPRNFTWKVTETGTGSDLKFREDPEAYVLGDIKQQVKIGTNKQETADPGTFLWEETIPQTNLKVDTDVTYNPAASSGGASVDALISSTANDMGGTTWAALRGGVVLAVDQTGTVARAGFVSAPGTTWYTMSRSFLTFDTSAGGTNPLVGKTIDSATVSVYGSQTMEMFHQTPVAKFNIYASTQTAGNSVETGDWGKVGTTAFSNPINITDFKTASYMGVYGDVAPGAGYNDFALNASGIANINTTGVSKFSFREANYDVTGTDPGFGSPVAQSSVDFYTGDNASNKPKLTISYSSSTSAPTVTTQAATDNTTGQSFTGNGTITATGGADVTARGFYWVTDASAGHDCSAAADGTQVAGTATSPFTATISGLYGNNYYCYRAYATNSAGTGYGAWTSVKTANGTTRTISDAGGNWNATTAWREGIVPTNADNVVATATSGNLTINVAAAAKSVNFTNYTGTLTHGSGVTLSIGNASGGSLTMVAGMTYTLGNFATSAINFVSTTTGNTITSAGKTFGNITFNGAGGAWAIQDATTINAFVITNGTVTAPNGILTVRSTFTIAENSFVHNSGTIKFLVYDDYFVTANNNTLNHVIVDGFKNGNYGGSGSVTFANSFTILGNLTVKNTVWSWYYGGTRHVYVGVKGTAGQTVTVNGNVTMTASNDLVYLGDSTDNININLLGNITIDTSNAHFLANTTFSGTTDQTVTATAGTFDNMIWTNSKSSGELKLGSNITISTCGPTTCFFPTINKGSYTINVTSYTITTGTASFTGSSPDSITTFSQSGGTFNAPSGNLSILGNFTKTTGTFNPNNGTIIFESTSGVSSTTHNLTTGDAQFYNLILRKTNSNYSDTVTLYSNITVLGNLSVYSAVNYHWSSGEWGAIIVKSDTSIKTINVIGSLELTYNAASGSTYFGANSATTNVNVNLSGDLTIADSASNNASNFFAPVTFNGAADQTVTKTAGTIDALSTWTINKASGSVILASAITGMTNSTITAGTLYTAGNTYTPTNLTVSNGATLKLKGTESVTAAPTLNTGSTVEYIGDNTAADLALKNFDYTNATLKINDVNVTKRNFTLPNGTRVFKNIEITSGKLDATTSNYNLSVSANWTNNGTFTARGGTVTLSGAGGSTQVIAGTTSFYNLYATATAARTINFASGTTQTVTGTLTITGTTGQLIILGRSGGADLDQWDINPTAWSIDYVNVSNSHNNAVAAINPPHHIDGGNNTNWFFIPPNAPTTALISNLTTTSFDVTWTDNSSDETGFKVYISTVSNADCSLATYPGSPDYTPSADIVIQAVSGKSVNTQYCAKVVATNADGDSTNAAYSDPVYTLANTPGVPTVDTPAATSLKITISANSNPAATQFAIFNETANKYIKADGSMTDTTPVWQTVAQWNTTGYVVNTGLSPNTSYAYKVVARNGDSTVTALSSGASNTTLSAINISGTVYTAENKLANIGENKTIAVSVDGTKFATTAETNASGAFTISNITGVSANSTIIVFVDDESGTEANLITQAIDANTSISGLELFTSKIVLRHETAGPLTNTIIKAGLGGSPDGNIHFTNPTGTKINFDEAYELWIDPSKNYTPGAEIGSAGGLDINGTLALQANYLTLTGSLDATGGSITQSGSTTTFSNASETQIITSDGEALGNVVFVNGGTREIADAADFTGTFTQSGGVLDLDTADPNVIIRDDIAFAGGTITKGSGVLTMAGDLNYMATPGTNPGAVAIGASPDTVTLTSDATYDSLTVNVGDSFVTAGYNVTVTNGITINGTLDATTVSGRNSSISLGGDWVNNGTFTASTSTVSLTGAGGSTQVVGGTVGTSFNNLYAATTTARTINFASGLTQTVTGLWTATGVSGQLLTLGRNGGSDADQWDINPTAWTVDYVNVSNSHNNASSMINAEHYTNGGNNTNWATLVPSTAPTDAAISNLTTTGFDVTWSDNSSDETSFRVYISTSPNADCSLATYPGTADYTTAANAELQAVSGKSVNTQYCAKVVAVNIDGNSSASYSTPKYTLANVPGSPTVDTPAITSLEVTIDANSNPVSTQFAILNETANKYVKADGSMTDTTPVWQTVAQWNTTGYVVNTGLNANTSYTYKIKAKNGDGTETALSAGVSKYTLANGPSVLTVDTPTVNSLKISITDNGSSQYAIFNETANMYVKADGSMSDTTPVWQAIGDWNTTGYVINTGLSANTSYTYKIKAKNGEGTETALSAGVSKYTLTNVPDAPTLSLATASTIKVNLTDNSSTKYSVKFVSSTTKYLKSDGTLQDAESWNSYADFGGATGIISSGLIPNSEYVISVAGQNGDSVATAYSATASSYTLAAVPAAPTINTPTTASLKVNINSNSNSAATEFAVYNETLTKYIGADGVADEALEVWQTVGDWNTTGYVVNTGLSANTNYTYKIKARNGDNTATALSVGTSSYTLADAPASIAATVLGQTSIKLDWVSGGTETKFNLYVGGEPGSGTLLNSAAVTTYTHLGLTAGTTYTYYLVAVNGNDVENSSFVTTSATTVAAPPGGSGSDDDDEEETTTTEETSTTTETETSGNEADSESTTPNANSSLPGILKFTNTASGQTVSNTNVGFEAPKYLGNDKITDYFWDFGDGTTSTQQKSDHKFNRPGRFTVTLTVTDSTGKVTTTTQKIDVRPIAPKITNITASGASLVIEGRAEPNTIIYFTIHSPEYKNQAIANNDGVWTFSLDNAKDVLGEGDHKVVALAAVKVEGDEELKSDDSKTYDFKVSVDEGRLKVEMKKTQMWQIIAGIFGFIIFVLLIIFVIKKKRA